MARKKGLSSKDLAVPPKGCNKSNIVQHNGNDGTVHQQTQHPGSGSGKNNVASQLQALTDRLKVMEDRAERSEAKVEKLQGETESAKKTMKANEQALIRSKADKADVDARFRKLETEKNALRERVHQLEATNHSLLSELGESSKVCHRNKRDGDIEGLKLEVSLLTFRIAHAEDEIKDSPIRQVYHSTDTALLKERMDGLEEKFRGLPNRANTFTQREVTAVRADLANLDQALAETDDLVADVTNDMSKEQHWSYEVDEWRDKVLVPGLNNLSRRVGLRWDWRPFET